MQCVNIDWNPFIYYTDNRLSDIKMKLNSTFDSILNGLDELRIESQREIELRLQEHIVSIADQQRKIARMNRQLSAATDLLTMRQHQNIVIETTYNKNIFYMILFGLIVGMTYERFIRPRFQ
jgi:hypothetical protein